MYAYPNRTEFFHYTGDYNRICLETGVLCPHSLTSYNAALARTRAHNEVNFSQLKSLKSLRVAPHRACDIAWAILHNNAPSETI